jgi:DNA (cytosine-5)-methyltransferase 1
VNTDDARWTWSICSGDRDRGVAAQQLGLRVAGIEHGPSACAPRRAAGLDTVEGGVRAYRPEGFPAATDLMGSPPCRPYSAAGEGAGRRALDAVLHVAAQVAARRVIQWVWPRGDGRTGLVLLLEPLRWTLQVREAGRPCRTVMFEQVHAEEYGVPQARAGAVLVARRGDQAALPAPARCVHSEGALPGERRGP